MKSDRPHILCINPWIHDFAAYDFWAGPVGLMILMAILRAHGFRVSYTDCLDRFHPKGTPTDPFARNGRGAYSKQKITKPAGLEDVTRTFSRYGIHPDWFRADLLELPAPDLILVTSMMTYWASGVKETIAVLKSVFPGVPVVLGGIYATLYPQHARSHSGADEVFVGHGEKEILRLAEKYTGMSVTPLFDPRDINTWPYPAFDLQRRISFIPLLTSRGCPFRCAYCASGFLDPRRMTREPGRVFDEIRHWKSRYNIKDYAFYDDALLIDADNHIIPLLEQVIDAGLKVRFHTPNALHIREITPRIARLMFDAGFETIRLGLETTAFERRADLDRKVTEDEFLQTVRHLKAAGFKANQIGAYLLAGLPGQSAEAVADSIQSVKRSGITPIPAYYTPIPHTALWKQAVAESRYDLEADPVFCNNAILPCRKEPFTWKMFSHLRNIASLR